MNALLVLSLLLPLSVPATPPAEIGNAALSTEVAQKIVLPPCAPPVFGTWMVASDCEMFGSRVAPDDVLVLDGVTLTLAAGSELDVDFSSHRLEVGVGSRVLIGVGARIH
jgi:hypothetical protein